MPPPHLIGESRYRGPDTADDQHEDCGQVTRKHRPAGYIVRPTHEGDREADYERQPEVHPKGRRSGFLTVTLAPFAIPLLTNRARRRLWWKSVEFPLDLPQLDCPVDFAQGILLPGAAWNCSIISTACEDAWQRTEPMGSDTLRRSVGEIGTRRRVSIDPISEHPNQMNPPCQGSPLR